MALIGTFTIFQVFVKEFRTKYRYTHFIFPVLLPFLFVGAWYYFVNYVNVNYGGSISPVDIRPFWIIDQEAISRTWGRIGREWVHSYYHVSFLITAGVLFLISIGLFKRSNKFLTVLNILTLIGGAGYFMLFFRSFYQHDYYMLNVFILIVFILVNALIFLKRYYPKVFKSYILKIFIAAAAVFFAIEANRIVDHKANSFYNDLHRKWFSGYVGMEDYNRSIGI
jgi:hypothetical protein